MRIADTYNTRKGTTMEITKEQIEDLVALGEIEINDDYIMRFREGHDDYTTIKDFDCYGKISWISRDRTRPEGFDGMAEIVSCYRDSYWWQPPEDLRQGWDTFEHKDSLRRTVRDILDYGFMIYVVEICSDRDAYGNLIVVDYASMGGIEPLQSDADKVEIVSDIVNDLLASQHLENA